MGVFSGSSPAAASTSDISTSADAWLDEAGRGHARDPASLPTTPTPASPRERAPATFPTSTWPDRVTILA